LSGGAPIDGFGVGTDMGVSRDSPSLDIAYKLVEYDGRGRTKLAPGKLALPGPKQVFRIDRDGIVERDVVGRRNEDGPGRPLLEAVMSEGRRLPRGRIALDECRAHAHASVACLPARIRSLACADPTYPVEISPALAADLDAARRQVAGRR
jgi:nicotinate phosphoribosyltransferase